MTMDRKPFLIFVLGPPASGKGTLCKKLADKYHQFLFHLSVGDYLRHLIIEGHLKDKAETVDKVKSGGTKGLIPGDQLVPLMVGKIKQEMRNGKSVFLLDGFPRDIGQDTTFKKIMKTEFVLDGPNLVIHVTCPREIARPRYLDRKRSDDSERLFDPRYSDYEDPDRQVLDLYRETLCEVDGSLGLEDAFQDMMDKLPNDPAWTSFLLEEGMVTT